MFKSAGGGLIKKTEDKNMGGLNNIKGKSGVGARAPSLVYLEKSTYLD